MPERVGRIENTFAPLMGMQMDTAAMEKGVAIP